MSQFLEVAVSYAWGTPLVLLLMGGGFYLALLSRLRPLRLVPHAFKMTFSKMDVPKKKDVPGQVSHFQALCTALSATIGLGNISGVAVATVTGGPGAIFWMWVAALIGMNTKFFECSLAVMYRGVDHRGEVQGGPMYVVQQAFSRHWQFLGIGFAVFGLLGTLPLFNVNQLASFYSSEYSVPPILTGFVTALIVLVVLLGNVQRVGRTTAVLVPTMGLIYSVCALCIIFLHISQVPDVFLMIFSDAFTGEAAFGGAAGWAVLQVMKTGVQRAAFSNEAGVGTAPMAHGNAKTDQPISEGLVAMLGPFFDTIVVCTMTALVILLTVDPSTADKNGILLTTMAFKKALPTIGGPMLSISVLLFSVSTAIGMANYNLKCWNFLFRGRLMGLTGFLTFYCGATLLGAISADGDVLNLLDLSYALMALPNMLITLFLASKVVVASQQYYQKIQ